MAFDIASHSFGSYNVTRDVKFYYSRPDLSPPTFKIHAINRELADSSYFFVCPTAVRFAQNGPYIFDVSGELLWSGAAVPRASASVGLRVCTFRKTPHLCFWEGDDSRTSIGFGAGKIMDQNYRIVAEISGRDSQEPIDFHDFHTIGSGDSLLATMYRSLPYDLHRFKSQLNGQIGWIWNCGFQEIESDTGRTVFEWWALDHVHPAESFTPIKIFDGQTSSMPWDFFHINSVEKTANGDYIISGRHTHCIYRVSGQNGQIIWRLGGKKIDIFTDFSFGFQHDVRIQKENISGLTLSIFNNGQDGRNAPVTNTSSGLIVYVSDTTRTATLIQSYSANIVSANQGNMVITPENNNVLLNYGSEPWLVEFTKNGTPTLTASIGGNAGRNYFATKGSWSGAPLDLPRIFVYARSQAHQLVVFVSWNGATKVRSWRFYGRDATDSTIFLGEATRTGFETRFIHQQFHASTFAEALGEGNQSLANSSITKAWIPGDELAKSCTNISCPIKAETQNMDDIDPPKRKERLEREGVGRGQSFVTSMPEANLPTIESTLALIGLFWLALRAFKIGRIGWRSFRRVRANSRGV